MPSIRTENLEIAYQVSGPEDGAPLMLLHGWPDDVRGWRQSAALLHASGWRTFAPYLRGFGPTRFLSVGTIRDGRGVTFPSVSSSFFETSSLSICIVTLLVEGSIAMLAS